MIVYSLRTAPTFGLPWAIPNLFTVSNLKRVGWGMRWVCASKQGIFAGRMGRTSLGFGMMKWFSKTLWSRCWNMARGARLMEGIGVVHLSSLNVPKEFGEIVESGRCRRKWGRGRRRWTSDWRIGGFWRPLIVTISSCTKQCLLQLLYFSSCHWNTTRCSR